VNDPAYWAMPGPQRFQIRRVFYARTFSPLLFPYTLSNRALVESEALEEALLEFSVLSIC